jgi:hypothetical protein
VFYELVNQVRHEAQPWFMTYGDSLAPDASIDVYFIVPLEIISKFILLFTGTVGVNGQQPLDEIDATRAVATAVVNTTAFQSFCPRLNIPSLCAWNISGIVDLIGAGCGDLLFDVVPSNGMYLDLNGTEGAGEITSKDLITLLPGKQYRLDYVIAGNNRNSAPGPDGVRVQLIPNIYSENRFVEWNSGFTTYHTGLIAPAGQIATNIRLTSLNTTTMLALGVLVKRVTLVNVTDDVIVFNQQF